MLTKDMIMKTLKSSLFWTSPLKVSTCLNQVFLAKMELFLSKTFIPLQITSKASFSTSVLIDSKLTTLFFRGKTFLIKWKTMSSIHWNLHLVSSITSLLILKCKVSLQSAILNSMIPLNSFASLKESAKTIWLSSHVNSTNFMIWRKGLSSQKL